MTSQLHHVLARQTQTELADRAERARQAREGEHLDAATRDRRLRERVMSVFRGSGAARSRRHGAGSRAVDIDGVAITLRLAGEADNAALADLAGLDSARVPAAPVLVAETSGKICAAVSLRDGKIIADPFHRTLAAQELLRSRAAQLRGDRGRAFTRRFLARGVASTRPLPAHSTAALGAAATNDHHHHQ